MKARLCQGCQEPLLGPSRSDRRYHGPACRKLAFVRRQRERESPGLGEPGELEAEALSESRLVEYVARAALSNWRAAAWLLERRSPERWGQGRREPDPAVAGAEDPFAEVDELAARRRLRPADD